MEGTKGLLTIGALLTFAGGLYAAIYNCRWYDNFGDLRRVWGGINGQMADCAATSGVFGSFTTLTGLASFVLMIMGMQNMITTIIFGVSLVFYLCMMIPEAIIINKGKYDISEGEGHHFIESGYSVRYEDDKDFQEWYMGGYEALRKYDRPAASEISEELGKQISWFNNYVLDVLDGYYVIKRMGISKCNRVGNNGVTSAEEFYKEVCGDKEEVQKYPLSTYAYDNMKPCVINYNASVFPTMNIDYPKGDCDKIDIVAECRGGWSESVLTRRAKTTCELQVEEIEAEKEGTAEEQVAVWKKWQIMDIESDTNFKLSRIRGLSAQNEIILSIQTIAFVMTAAGVVLSFFGGSIKKDDGDVDP